VASPRRRVVVLDYGSGNVRSAVRALERAGAEVELTSDRAAAESADGLVVPGVGAYAACMAGLRAVDGPRTIGRRLAGARPVLGICVGMQVLFARGVEHGVETEGCDEWPGTVSRGAKVVQPFLRSGLGLAVAGWNLAARAARREFAYPGLQRLVGEFYRAVESPMSVPPPVTAEQSIAVAEARDRIVALAAHG